MPNKNEEIDEIELGAILYLKGLRKPTRELKTPLIKHSRDILEGQRIDK